MIDDLTLIVAGRELSGWTSIRVTRGIERFPSDFQIEMTELHPDDATAFTVQAGEACIVKLGGDAVVTGYIDRFSPTIGPGQHSIRVSGRSKCADLVDCAAEWPGGQISGADVLGIAQKLVLPYGGPDRAITVSAPGSAGLPIQTFNLMLGETPYEIIERICRYSALLAYDDSAGNLVLSQVSDAVAASGFTQGENIQSAAITYSMDQRYSEYMAYVQPMETFQDVGDGGNLIATFNDPYVGRHRRKVIISESGDVDFTVTQKRAMWEAKRRMGRSFQLRLTCDSWRDKAGVLWQPNTLVPLEIAALKLTGKKWTVSEVTYKRDMNGTTAELIIMPAEAFDVQPFLLFPVYGDVPNLGAT